MDNYDHYLEKQRARHYDGPECDVCGEKLNWEGKCEDCDAIIEE